MGILDFLTGRGKAAPAPAGAVKPPVTAEGLKKEIAKLGLDAPGSILKSTATR